MSYVDKVLDGFGNLKLSSQLFFLISCLAVGIMTAVYFDDMNDKEMAVNGSQYQKVVLQKDLVADVLPPPEYLLEAWKVCLEMVALKESSKRDLVEQGNRLSKDFIDRHGYWLANLPRGSEIDKQMNNEVYETGIAFIRLRDEDFIPALRVGDAAAIDASLSRLHSAYNRHRQAVDEVVKISNALTTKIEAETAYKIKSGQTITYVITSCLIVFAVLISVLVVSSIRRKLGGEVNPVLEAARALAEGDMTHKIKVKAGDKNSVTYSMHSLQQNLKALIDSLNYVNKEMQNGSLHINIHSNLFKGSYADVTQIINRMLEIHSTDMAAVMGCVEGFGEGYFDAELKQFPGEKEYYNNKIERVRENLKALCDDAQMLANAAEHGNMSLRADANQHSGDFRLIIDGFNNTLDLILKPIHAINEAVETINTIAGEISSSNNDLAKRTEQQAASLEETAATMEELSTTVKQNAEHALHANNLAEDASHLAERGGEAVGKVVITMNEINESAHKISDIISVIDGIAFQTNILALNAAVEAARAGEQGRGFAVVAGEVRSLAQRSSNAAKEIKDLINNSVQKTREGTLLVEDAGKTMHEIVSSFKSVSDIIEEIANASQEQSIGLDQINLAISNLDDTTQQNVVMVEEAAVAASSLSDQANNLFDNVSVFKVGEIQQTTPAFKAPAKPAKQTSPKPANIYDDLNHKEPSNHKMLEKQEHEWESF